MKCKIGILLILVGLFLLGGAAALLLHNRGLEAEAARASGEVIPQVRAVIRKNQEAPQTAGDPALPHFLAEQAPDPQREMPAADIDGEAYIGYLSIPALELELPVMSGWSYSRLRIAPCRYAGSLYLDDLVIMAHNYSRHFGGIKDLRRGDRITFTDVDGLMVEFEVVALDVLEPAAVEEMTAGEYDLTLFTCTYGGQSRVTVRCDRVAQEMSLQ